MLTMGGVHILLEFANVLPFSHGGEAPGEKASNSAWELPTRRKLRRLRDSSTRRPTWRGLGRTIPAPAQSCGRRRARTGACSGSRWRSSTMGSESAFHPRPCQVRAPGSPGIQIRCGPIPSINKGSRFGETRGLQLTGNTRCTTTKGRRRAAPFSICAKKSQPAGADVGFFPVCVSNCGSSSSSANVNLPCRRREYPEGGGL